MTQHMLDLLRALAWEVKISGPVLEFGSRIEANQEHLDLRRAFPPGTPYLGVDVIEGPGVGAKADLLDPSGVHRVLDYAARLHQDFPKAILCLYVLEHVWEIRKAASALGDLWQQNPESWLFVSTHQSQPYHGTDKYPDYWRITATGMKRLVEEAGVEGAHVLVHPDSSNPTDVLAVRQPASMAWPTEAFEMALRTIPSHWEMVF